MFHIDTVRLKETQDPDTNFSILTGDKFFPGLHVANTFQLYFDDRRRVIKGLVRLFFFFFFFLQYAMDAISPSLSNRFYEPMLDYDSRNIFVSKDISKN